MQRTISICSLTFVLAALATAQDAARPFAPDTPEPGSVEAIARYTTEEHFGSPWVAYVPESDTVPSPGDFLGHVVGAPGELTRTETIYEYFRELAKASARVSVSVLGKTEEGREILLAAIADEDGIRRLDEWKAKAAALSDPRRTTPEEAGRLAAGARPIYYLNAGLHSSETGSPEMVMELAYRLAVSEQPMIRRIREQLVVLVNPVSEPDGRDKQVDWFYRHLKGKTDFERLPPKTPPFWGHYVFHDNNRDTHQVSLQITRAVHRMFHEYHPTVVHDLHESIPLLQTWNGTGPFNPLLDPITVSELFEMSFVEVSQLTSFGMPGVWTWGFGEGWGMHYLESVAINHNSIGRGYETFGNSTAETVERRLHFPRESYAGKRVTSPEWYRPLPPERSFRWSLRNNTNYMETACLAILDYSAKNAGDLLRRFYRKGWNSYRKGLDEKPYAYVVRRGQGDPLRVAEMLNLLMRQGIEVSSAPAEITVGGESFAAGSYVVRLDQPYRNYAVDLLSPQQFPADSPNQPYDDVSWALSVHYGVEVVAVDDESVRELELLPVEQQIRPRGEVRGTGPVYLLADTGQEALLAARFRLGTSIEVSIAEDEFSAAGRSFPAGSWILQGEDVRDAVGGLARELALDFVGVETVGDVRRHAAPVPRLALWQSWADTESAGWVRLVLDRQKIPYTLLRDEDVRAGALSESFDVLVFPHNSLDLQDQIHGIDRRFSPLAYTRTPELPSHGVPVASEDITGGIGWTGMAELQSFVEAGGVLVTLGGGSALALDGGLARGVHRAGGGVRTPGAELTVRFLRPGHPIAYGYPEVTSAFRRLLPVYGVRRADRDRVVLQWGTRPPAVERDEDEEDDGGVQLLVSGGLEGGEKLEGRPAILDVRVGQGRVVAYNFNPIHRDLNHSDHRFFWNAILSWSYLRELD